MATTRPETILGDSAIAVNSNDSRYAKIHGEYLRIPILGREIPIITDETVETAFGTGALKVTPSHDPIDYEIGLRHNLESTTVIGLDGKMSESAGEFQGIDRFECREFIVQQLSLNGLFEKIEPKKTGFLVISKSGSTAETLAQFIYCLEVFGRNIGWDKLCDHFTSITKPGYRPLRQISENHGITVLDHHPEIGGRYSAFSVTGILPALIAGVDGEALRNGAIDIINTIANADSVREVAPAVGAVLAVGLANHHGIAVSVFMPYLDRLERFSKWYRQLWAESLGKKGQGMTPVDAMGTVDQHSQLQLYLEGPKDKYFTLIVSEMRNKGGFLPKELVSVSDLQFLANQRIGDLMAAEQRATFETLVTHNCPTRLIEISDLDEYVLGSLMMHFMLETILAADLMGVNPFDQPAVDEGKKLVRKIMNERRN